MTKVREPSSKGNSQVRVRCHLTLDPHDTITKKLLLEGRSASGVRIQCRGALLAGARNDQRGTSLEIRSRRPGPKDSPSWQRPEDITVQDCRIDGRVRVGGMTDNELNPYLRRSSHSPGHTARARNAAPRRLHLQRLSVRALGSIPLYVYPGVTELSLTDSMLSGTSDSVAIYLDAESGHNEIRNNVIAVHSSRRELIAVDGSSDNLIVNNLLLPGEHGGIYLYRNCGERGTIRHNRPERNRIINNVFLYAPGEWDDPAIFIGSRNGSAGYCHEDDGYPLGSSASDLDFARYNVLLQNRFGDRQVADAIRVGDPQVDRPNTLLANETVSEFRCRLAGCYVEGNGTLEWIEHGQSIAQIVNRGASEVCMRQRCEDGNLRDLGSCALQRMHFECHAKPDQSECSTTVSCPAGTTPLAAMAGCDLQGEAVSPAELLALQPGWLVVYRGSMRHADNTCQVGSTRESQRRQVIRFDAAKRGSAVPIYCRSTADKTACDLRGQLFCTPSP